MPPGLDTAKEFAFWGGIVFLAFETPFAVYLLFYAIYAYAHPQYEKIKLSYYIKKWQFYLPFIAAAAIFVLLLLGSAVEVALPYDIRPELAESMENGILFELPYTEDLQEYESKIGQMPYDELINFVIDHSDDREEVDDEFLAFINYIHEYEFDNFFCIFLPVHEGKTESLALDKASYSDLRHMCFLRFTHRTDDTKAQYLTFYIISRENMQRRYLFDGYSGINDAMCRAKITLRH